MKDKKWLQKASTKMKAKWTKWKFTEYCWGKVTDECVKKWLKSPDPTIVKRASFAKSVRKF